mmetsp:Transcript_51075/g.141440  ORF Transcript_51075/g.141440 Transcript_51075/m.141440 type:complete len:226 (-) Transcript_51075:90-767(-)
MLWQQSRWHVREALVLGQTLGVARGGGALLRMAEFRLRTQSTAVALELLVELRLRPLHDKHAGQAGVGWGTQKERFSPCGHVGSERMNIRVSASLGQSDDPLEHVLRVPLDTQRVVHGDVHSSDNPALARTRQRRRAASLVREDFNILLEDALGDNQLIFILPLQGLGVSSNTPSFHGDCHPLGLPHQRCHHARTGSPGSLCISSASPFQPGDGDGRSQVGEGHE